MMATEVTRAQFAAFVNATGYLTDAEQNAGGSNGCWAARQGRENKWDWTAGVNWRNADMYGETQTDSHPAVCISYNDVLAFIKWLNAQTNATYRLPSEAEWEYAARGGSESIYHFGANASQLCEYSNLADKTPLVNGNTWTNKADCQDGYSFTAPVSRFKPNAFGLYDIHGNVWEWLQDCWNASYTKAPTNGSAWMQGDCSLAVLRGGSWSYDLPHLRSSYRYRNYRSSRSTSYGFRLAQEVRP